ncbi:ESX-1 secretion-associated protein [Mycobacterium sp. NPDC003449]
MTAGLGVTVTSLRETATGLDGLASGLYNDGGGPMLAAAAGPVSGLDTGAACREVGDAFLRRAQVLGDGASAFAGRLSSAATLYERGDSEAAERIEFDPPEAEEKETGDDPGEPGYDPVDEYEAALRDAGLLDGPKPDGFYREWLRNASDNDVPPEVIVDIARRQHITPQSFDVLKGSERVTDKDGKSFFLLPKGLSAEQSRKAALMTYVLNAGTDYAKGNPDNDFAETPYSADEIQRIVDRQSANGWSYGLAEHFDGRLTTTPNGMLMGLGGDLLDDQLSQQAGSTAGDVFLVNIDNPADPAQTLRSMIGSGQIWYSDSAPSGSTIDLDRILHHEERHSQQWADLGFTDMVGDYGLKMIEERLTSVRNPFETNAGASDGGYP